MDQFEGALRGYSFGLPASIPSETKVSFGLQPCKVLQKGHREKVTLSGSLSICARSISTCVGTSRFVFGHLNINCVNGTSNGTRLTAFLHARNKLPKGLSRAGRCATGLVRLLAPSLSIAVDRAMSREGRRCQWPADAGIGNAGLRRPWR